MQRIKIYDGLVVLPYDALCFVPYFLWHITAVTPCFPLSRCTKYSARGRRMKGKKMYMDQGSRSSGSASVWIWLSPTLSWLGIYTHLYQAGLCRMWTPNDEEEAYKPNCQISHNSIQLCWICCSNPGRLQRISIPCMFLPWPGQSCEPLRPDHWQRW